MPPYFYSSAGSSSEIRAATGVKGLMFCDDELADAFSAFWHADSETHLDDPINKYEEAVKTLYQNKDFSEEVDHYSIVDRSKAAKSLYIWNVVCRMAYSSHYGHSNRVFGKKNFTDTQRNS